MNHYMPAPTTLDVSNTKELFFVLVLILGNRNLLVSKGTLCIALLNLILC